ncbi:hypothetical protein BD769DRAFT_1462218 [Suillus cothurnatus]|nr:hypothetical protein BD769DRAFT_1462218 [Suillus cothurnatus]
MFRRRSVLPLSTLSLFKTLSLLRMTGADRFCLNSHRAILSAYKSDSFSFTSNRSFKLFSTYTNNAFLLPRRDCCFDSVYVCQCMWRTGGLLQVHQRLLPQ